MALVPSVEDYLRPIVDELRLDVFQQRLKMAERLINFPPEKMSALHLEEWYFNYWRLLGMFQYVNDPPEQKEPPARQQVCKIRYGVNTSRWHYYFSAKSVKVKA